jgi:hypothetical protein
VAGKTHNIDARAVKNFVLTDASGSSTITCTGLGTVGAVLLGSNAGTHGSDNEITTFSGCKLKGNSSDEGCHLAPQGGSDTETTETITTEPLKSELVENVEAGNVGKQLLELFSPAEKIGFVKLLFGGECTLKSTIVSGSTVAEVVLDNASEGKVELGQTPQQRTSWLIRFPEIPIHHVWLISGGVGKEVETGQEAFNEESIQHGTALVLLAGTKFQSEPNALWSPLP